MISVNLGAAYQALGRVDDAIKYYEAALPHLPTDIGLLNNYGSLLGIPLCVCSNNVITSSDHHRADIALADDAILLS